MLAHPLIFNIIGGSEISDPSVLLLCMVFEALSVTRLRSGIKFFE